MHGHYSYCVQKLKLMQLMQRQEPFTSHAREISVAHCSFRTSTSTISDLLNRFFSVLLTVHLSIILITNQLNVQILVL